VADQQDVRRIALALPGVTETQRRFGFSVERGGKAKEFVWAWQERVHPKKPRVSNPGVIAARVADLTERAALISGDPDVFFTEPHYAGFPAVLVRLAAIDDPKLRRIVEEAWQCLTPSKPASPRRSRRTK
jgi:hypothetical protein